MPKVQGRRSAAEWRTLVQEWSKSGKTREEFSSAHGLRPSTLGWWGAELRRRARVGAPATSKASRPSLFLPVRVAEHGRGLEPAPPPRSPATVTVEVVLAAGIVLRVPVGADVAWVMRLFEAVRGVPC